MLVTIWLNTEDNNTNTHTNTTHTHTHTHTHTYKHTQNTNNVRELWQRIIQGINLDGGKFPVKMFKKSIPTCVTEYKIWKTNQGFVLESWTDGWNTSFDKASYCILCFLCVLTNWRRFDSGITCILHGPSSRYFWALSLNNFKYKLSRFCTGIIDTDVQFDEVSNCK